MSFITPIGAAGKVQKSDVEKNRVVILMNSFVSSLFLQFTNSFNLVWKNPNLSPQEMMNAFGTDAGFLLNCMQGMQDLVNQTSPGALAQVPPAFVINKDGTVTVS